MADEQKHTHEAAKPCPNCGYCPHCGRANPVWPQRTYPYIPYVPHPYPITPYPSPWYPWRIGDVTWTVTSGTNPTALA